MIKKKNGGELKHTCRAVVEIFGLQTADYRLFKMFITLVSLKHYKGNSRELELPLLRLTAVWFTTT